MKRMLRGIYLIIKRIIDIILSAVLLVLLFIPFIIVAITIKAEDGGPVFYRQLRVGKNLKLFEIYKFRSMKTNRKELEGSMKHDEMVTKVGQFIRKTSIDELPQLINILKGQMSFIGPRPWMPEYYVWFTQEQKRRSDVLPGITGLAQAKGRNNINIFKKIDYDIQYVEHISLFLDIKIIILTIMEIFAKTGVEVSEAGIKSEIEELKRNKEEQENTMPDDIDKNQQDIHYERRDISGDDTTGIIEN